MSRWNFRSGTPNHSSTNFMDETPSPGGLAARVGRAIGKVMKSASLPRQNRFVGMEALEARVLLDGNFQNATALMFDPSGRASVSASIDPAVPASDHDFYTFVATSADFVSVLADTVNESPASNLDTRVTVYSEDDTSISIASGLFNGERLVSQGGLTSGFARDGWVGFITQPGKRYFIVVSSDNSVSAPVAGTYTLRVSNTSTKFDIGLDTGIARELGSPPPMVPMPPITPILGLITRLQEDQIYQYTVPADAPFSSLVTVNAVVTRPPNAAIPSDRLDTHLQVFRQSNASGAVTRISFDSDAGRFNDAFTTFRAKPGEVFYIRVRSDEIRPNTPSTATGTGSFFLVLDGRAEELPNRMNPITRLGSEAGGAFVGFGPPTTPPTPAVPNPAFQTAMYRFTSQGTGLTIITAVPTGIAPVNDPALRLFDDQGNLVAFNDNAAGTSAQLEVQLIGGRQYFVVVDGFAPNNQVQFQLFIESNHTFDTNPNNINDDHINTPAGPLTRNAARRIFEEATPLTFGAPFVTLDGDSNIVRDRGVRATAVATGRLHQAGDRDLFSFVPPVNMLGSYGGNNDDAGTSLFIGGAFTRANPFAARPTVNRSLLTWDANDYWYTGRQFFDPIQNVQWGIQDNPNTPLDHAAIYTITDWDPFPTTESPVAGTTDNFMVIGGDFRLIFPDPATGLPVIVDNLAIWGQNPNNGVFSWSAALGSVDGPVRSSVVFDPPAPMGGADPIPVLAIGGSFTSVGGGATPAANIAFFDINNGWVEPAGGSPGPVHAMVAYNPPDPGAGRNQMGLPVVPDPPDRPLSLAVGGDFTFVSDTPANLAGTYSGPLFLIDTTTNEKYAPNQGASSFTGGARYNVTITGVINALATFEQPDPDGAGPWEEQEMLFIGGAFTLTQTVNQPGAAPNWTPATFTTTNIAAYGRIDANEDAMLANYMPKLLWEPLSATVVPDGPVNALANWDPPDLNGNVLDPVLLIGGEFTSIGNNIGAWFGLGYTNAFFQGGTDGAVNAIVTIADIQEPQVDQTIGDAPQAAVYIGGAFQNVFDDFGNPTLVNHVAQWSAFVTPFGEVFAWSTMLQGVAVNVDADFGPTTMNDPGDPPAFAPNVHALGAFDDGDPYRWDRHDRPATRLAVTVSPTFGGFENTRTRILDSNFNVVYDFGRPGSESIAPPFPDPSGMTDPSVLRPPNAPTGGLNPEFVGIPLWGGETYYLEVSDVDNAGNPRGGTGRYNVVVTVDGLPTDINGDGVRDEVNGTFVEEPNEGQFTQALRLNTALGSGDATNFVAADTLPLHGNSNRVFPIAPALGNNIIWVGDIGNIASVDDTDLWSFRAEFTGTAEIRLATLGLGSGNAFGESLDGGNSLSVALNRTYDSPLDGAIRVFRADFEQIAYNDDNPGVSGDVGTEFVGTLGTRGNAAPVARDFRRKDPRVVIPVVAGNFYYIQVESGLRFRTNAQAIDPADRVPNIERELDRRFATGAYELLVNAMPFVPTFIETVNGVNVTVQDDFFPGPNQGGGSILQSAVIPISIAGSDNGTGSLDGTINNWPAGVDPGVLDNDFFTFIAPGAGNVTITVDRRGTPTLLPSLAVFNAQGQQIGTGTPSANGGVAFTTPARTGERFYAVVFGSGQSEGDYRISVAGVRAADDHADPANWADATDIILRDFLGSGSATGQIESGGDRDIFRFKAFDHQIVTVNVTATTPGFDPFVTIYEVSENQAGLPVFLRLAYNDNANVNTTNSSISFPVTPRRRVDPPLADPAREYPYYYIVVRGSNWDADVGSYNVSVTFPATDDHADGDTDADGVLDTGEFPFATTIQIDSQTGIGGSAGNIELATDSDLFSFTAPAGGRATVSVSRPAGSLLRSRVTILSETGAILASGTGDDSATFSLASANNMVVRNTRYFIVVQPFEDPLVPNTETTLTGLYTVSVTTPPIDDHANADEYTLATTIPIDPLTGMGQVGGTQGGDASNARIGPANDTDLFRFVVIQAGTHTITVTPFDTTFGRMAPRMTLLSTDDNGATPMVLQVVTATQRLQQITLTIANATVGTEYFLLVEAAPGVPLANPTGEYQVKINGPTPNLPPDGTNPSVIDFNNPVVVVLDPRTGDGEVSSLIEVADDRDLFTFTTFSFNGPGKVFIQLVTPLGSLLNGTIRVLRLPNELPSSEVAFDADGIAGVTASTSFNALPGTQYWVVVDGVGASTGSYTLKVNTEAAVNVLYFPEGFSNDGIREFVSIVNPNNVLVNYTIRLRYEVGNVLETTLLNQTINPNSRNGTTINDRTVERIPNLLLNIPYSIIIESDAPLGATLAHYDFGTSIGDSFIETVAKSWNFARAERRPGSVRDFIVFYNPSAVDIDVTMTAHQTGKAPVSVTARFSAGRRGGFSIDDFNQFPVGVFSIILTAKAADPAQESLFSGIVASLSHYQTVAGTGFSTFGDQGSTAGVIPSLTQGTGVESELVFFNPGTTPVSVTITGTYVRTTLPNFTRTYDIPAKAQVTVTGRTLGLVNGQPVGIRYQSSGAITVLGSQVQRNDADATASVTTVGTEFFFGDAFIETSQAGTLYFETLNIYNPTNSISTISIKLLFLDGSAATIPVNVNARGYAEVRLHERPEIVTDRSGPVFFAVDATSSSPFIMTMTHYDLFLGAGYTTSGTPFGITGPLSRIV